MRPVAQRVAPRDLAVWLLRMLWFMLPITTGMALADALDGYASSTRTAIIIGAWVLWATGVVSTAVLLPASLTAVRILAPAACAAAIWAVVVGDVTAIGLIGLAVSLIAAIVALTALVGDRFVDGASYGDERRMLLRPPIRLLASAIPLVWALVTGGVVVGPLLLAAGRFWLGAALTVLGLVVAVLGARALHQLTRRWIVFVPTGMVLHDLSVLTEPVLFRRTAVERLGAAIAGTPAKDLSNRAAGLLLECELTDPAPLGLRRLDRSQATAELTDVRRFLFAPSRPGELLDEAQRRKIAVD